MFTYPFEIIKLRLSGISEFREIDLYMDQDSTTDKSVLVLTAPGAYIDFVPVDEVKTHGNKMQSMEVDIVITLLTETVQDSGTKLLNKTQPKSHMALYDAVNQKLQGFNALKSYLPQFAALANTPNDEKVMNSLTRGTQLMPPRRVKALLKSQQAFRTIIFDHSACKKYTKITGTELGTEFE